MNINAINPGIYQQFAANSSQAVESATSAAQQAGGSVQGTGASFSFKLPQHIDPAVITDPQKSTPTSLISSDITEPTSWGQMVQRMALDVNQSQNTAADKVKDVLAGGSTSVQEAMISVQESSVRFQMLAEVRNKMLDAYQEVMRMQI